MLGCKQKKDPQNYHPSNKKYNPRKPLSWGQQQTIYVFADNNVWNKVEDIIKGNLCRFFYTTDNENYFVVKRAGFEAIDQYYKFKNLLFLGDVNSNDEVANYIKESLNKSLIDKVKNDGFGLFHKENLWANDQFVCFALGNSLQNIIDLNINQSEKIFDLFKDILIERIKTKTYAFKILPKSSFNGLPWTAKIPSVYRIFREDKTNNFVSYIARLRKKADRFFAVYYEKINKETDLEKWLIKTRKEIFWKYYEEDTFNEDDVKFKYIRIAGYDGIEMKGNWFNDKLVVGGVFRSIAFVDKKTNTAFLIDNSIYYPEGYKLSAFIELKVISDSFLLKK